MASSYLPVNDLTGLYSPYRTTGRLKPERPYSTLTVVGSRVIGFPRREVLMSFPSGRI